MTTKECLHRFCADCIITALRSGWVHAIAWKRDFTSDKNVVKEILQVLGVAVEQFCISCVIQLQGHMFLKAIAV